MTNNGHQPARVDPALADHLAELADIAHDIGAAEVLILRGARSAQLSFTADLDVLKAAAKHFGNLITELPFEHTGIEVSARGTAALSEAAVLVLLAFPAGDGEPAGLEVR